MTAAQRSALVVANDTYHDERLRRLRAPAIDAAHLARVLGDADIGGFDVDVSLNEPEHVVRRKLSAFFDNRSLDDILILHLSCHGVKDEDGRLYFATPDTQIDQLDATSLPADFVNRQMTRSRSRRIVLLLDCCYSGAFARGMLNRGDDRVDLVERFDGRGRIVLTASSAMEYSFEGDELTGEGSPSVFTSAVIEGLATGEADRNRDGYVSVDELYDYAFDRVREATPSQTPGKWVFDVQGDFYLARSVRPPEPVDPLADLRGSITSPFTNVRLGAVEELTVLLDDPNADRAAAAMVAMEQLADGDSVPLVRSSADRARRMYAAAHQPPPPPPPPPVQQPAPVQVAAQAEPQATLPSTPPAAPPPTPLAEPKPMAPAEPQPPSWVPTVGRVAGISLLAGVPVPWLSEGQTTWNTFAVIAPFEVALAGLALILGAGALSRKQLATSSAAGLFVAVGVLVGAAGLGMLRFAGENLGGLGLALAFLMTAGAAAAVVAGTTCWRIVAAQTDQGRPEPLWLALSLLGTLLTAVALFVPYDGNSSLWDEVVEGSVAEYCFEPAAAVAVLAAGALLLSSRRHVAAAILIAGGALTAAHYLGVLVAASFAIGEEGEVGIAGWIGVAGGLLAAFAGWQAEQSSRG